jgi:hypothetical protein
MMKMITVLAAVLLWTTPVMAETYSWVDDSGTYNFTEEYSRVPKKYRNKVDKRGDMGASAQTNESVAPPSKSNAIPPADAKNAAAGKPGTPAGSFGGKSYDQWKQEFGEREAAMGVIKRRIDEIDALLKSAPPNGEQTRSLLAERHKAAEQFNELRKQYDQFAEQARKAGIKVTVTQ